MVAKQMVSLIRQLRDDPLKPWTATHATLKEYLYERWGISERRQQQLLAAEDTRILLADEAPELKPTVEAMPEGQVRVLVQTPPEKRLEVLRKAIELTAKGKPSGPALRKAKAIVTGVTVEPAANARAAEGSCENQRLNRSVRCDHLRNGPDLHRSWCGDSLGRRGRGVYLDAWDLMTAHEIQCHVEKGREDNARRRAARLPIAEPMLFQC